MLYIFNREFNKLKAVKYKSAYKVKVRFVAPAQEAKAIAPLAPIFGQFGLSCIEFCKQFNEKTVHYPLGIILTVDLEVLFDRTFRYNINGINFTELISSVSDDNNFLLLIDIYRLVFLYMKIYNKEFWPSFYIIAGTVRGGLLEVVNINDY